MQPRVSTFAYFKKSPPAMINSERRPVLVTGSMRSGTTFVGNVLAAADNLFYLHEPLNPVWGIESNSRWFLYVRDANDEEANIIDRLMTLNVEFRAPETGRPLRDTLKKWLGVRSSWRAVYYRHFAKSSSRLLLKDPLAAFASRYMHVHHGAAVIALIRHPMAFYYSNKRLGWDFDFGQLLVQEQLLDDHLSGEVGLLHRDDLNYPQRMGLLWRCVYKVLTTFTQEAGEEQSWVLKRHEDICTQPRKEFRDVFRRIGSSFDGEVEQFISKHMNTSNSVKAGGKTHKLQRNSSGLVDYWRSTLRNGLLMLSQTHFSADLSCEVDRFCKPSR